MQRKKERLLAGHYFIAFLAPALVAIVMQLSWPFFQQSPISLFLMAVMFTAWYGGLGPGLLSVLVSFLLADYFFVAPYFALWPPGRGDFVYLVILVMVGSCISSLSELLHRSRRKAEWSLESTKRAEETLRRSEVQLAGVISSAMDAIISIDEGQRIVLFNAAAEKMFLCPVEQASGQLLDQFIPERFRSTHSEHIQDFSRTHVSKRSMGALGALFGRRANGDEFPIEASISQLESDGRKFYTVILRDITERVQAEAALQMSEERVRTVTENARVGLVMLNYERRYTFANATYCEFLELPNVDIVGQRVADVLAPLYERQIRHHLDRAFAGERVAYELRRPAAGEDRYYAVRYEPTRVDGSVSLVVVVLTDITERKHAETALDAERKLLRTLIDLLPDYIYVKDTQSQFLACNEACAQIMGVATPAALTGKTDADFYPARLAAIFRADELAVLEGTAQINKEEPSTQPDGTREFILTTKLPIKDSSGRITGLIGYGRNVTASRLAEEALRASEARYRTLFECAPDGIVVADQESTYIDANSTICRMLGYSRDELIGLHASKIVTQGEIQHIGKAFGVLKAKENYSREWELRRKDGSVFAAEVIATLMPDGNLLAMIRDISERQHAENAVRQSEDRLDFALQVSETGAWDLDLLDHTAYRSLQHDRIFGYQTKLATWTYEVFLDHILPEDRLRVNDLFSRAVADKGDWSFECGIRRADGEIRWIWASGRHRFDESGDARRMSGIVQDITERKRAELEILKLNEELEQRVAERTAQLQAVNKELEAFSYSVSHDLRAPLRHINGFSLALLEDYADKLDEIGKGYLQEVRGATHEMAQLIDDVLELARVARSEMHRECVNLSELAQSVVAELRKADAPTTAAVEIQEGLLTHGDKRLLRIVLTNLLGNAWKFSSKQEQPEISFGSDQSDGETVYFVRDNGAGFDMAFADKLFGAFQRLHSSAEFEGTGIGLATVQRIINRHGGRVWANGKVNLGATFSFTLPDIKGQKV